MGIERDPFTREDIEREAVYFAANRQELFPMPLTEAEFRTMMKHAFLKGCQIYAYATSNPHKWEANVALGQHDAEMGAIWKRSGRNRPSIDSDLDSANHL